MPIFLVIFALLGFVAGVRTMLRTARQMAADQDKTRGRVLGRYEGKLNVAAEEEGTGFAIHPMDQFVVKPLFRHIEPGTACQDHILKAA